MDVAAGVATTPQDRLGGQSGDVAGHDVNRKVVMGGRKSNAQ
jgi:hypothetical protein